MKSCENINSYSNNLLNNNLLYKCIIYSLLFFLSRWFFLTDYIFNSDEMVSYRMLDNFYEYFVKDVHLFFYDYLTVGVFSFFFGKNILFLRILNIFFSLATVFVIGDIICKKISKKLSYVFFIFYLFSPFFLFYSIYTECYTFSLFLISLFLRYMLILDFKKNKWILFFVIMFAGYTHYFNIIFLFIFCFIYYLLKKITFKEILFYFISFLPLIFLVFYKYYIGMDNSELFDFNSILLSFYLDKNIFSSIFYIISGIIIEMKYVVFPVIIYILFFLYSIYKEKDFYVKTTYLSAFIYSLIVFIISLYANFKFDAKSFTNDYMVIVSFIFLLPLLKFLSGKNTKYLLFIILCIFIFQDLNFYYKVKNINSSFDRLKKISHSKKTSFVVHSDAIAERLTDEFVRVIFKKEPI
ncbi:MAG: glycosyltransferase family 39 protein, partial [Candidatus Muirbacterium halophilum]|nr:glycosyltransferase family 39 protein [Candidatus Muirbacterium halophilum]